MRTTTSQTWAARHSTGIIIAACIALFSMLIIIWFCVSRTSVPENAQAVEIKTPWFGGASSCGSTLTGPAVLFHAASTRYETMSLASFPKLIAMEDVPTSDGYLLDFRMSMTFRLLDATPLVCTAVGKAWFESFIQAATSRAARQAISATTFVKILGDTATQNAVDKALTTVVDGLIKEHKLPIVLVQLNLGKVTLDAAVLAQMNKTTAAIQSQNTAVEEERSQLKRAASETARAAADAAYVANLRKTTGFSISEFLLREQIKACAETKGTCVIGMPNTSVALPPGSSK